MTLNYIHFSFQQKRAFQKISKVLLTILWLLPFTLFSASDSTLTPEQKIQELNIQLQNITSQLLEIQSNQPQIEIDSTQKLTAEDTAWVTFRGKDIWPIYLSYGTDSPSQRAEHVEEKLNDISFFSVEKVLDSLKIVINNGIFEVKSGDDIYFVVSPKDALLLHQEIEPLTKKHIQALQAQSGTDVLIENNEELLWRMGKVLLVIFILFLIAKLLNIGYRKVNKFIASLRGKKLKGITIRNFEIINDHQVVKIFLFFTRIIRLVLVLILVFFSLPIIFGLFPWTESLAATLLNYILDPLYEYFWMFIHYIPNIISIAIIAYIGHFILKFITYLSSEIENQNLSIIGFYPEWAKPTANLAKFAVYIILLIFIFPFLPGSESPIFKGVSVFVGILITMGSSSSVNNVIAGLVLTYMRPFKKGDRIKVENILGFVIEKNLLVTRLRTSKQEIITIPNSKILNTNIINYSISIQENDGVIVHNIVTIGYDVPWRKVHKALLKATENIDSIASEPKPFVLQNSLDDFYVSYEINAYVNDVKTIIGTASKLNENIQDVFRDAEIEILSPHYKSWRDGQEITIPKKVKEDYTFKTEQVDDHTPELDQQQKEEQRLAREKKEHVKTKMPTSFTEMIGQVDEVVKQEKIKDEETLKKELEQKSKEDSSDETNSE